MIKTPYVLFTRIPVIKNEAGKIFCDRLWAKDLCLHLDYISDFRLCCPVVYSNDTHGLDEITEFDIGYIYELRKDYGFRSVAINIFANLSNIIKACKEASIVHSGGAGWAFPLSFYLFILAPFISFQWVIVIESSDWMFDRRYQKISLRKLISHYTHKIILSGCVKKADARIFTQSFYRKYFLKKEEQRTLIAPATWVDKSSLTSREVVEKRCLDRKGKPIEIIFPSRLIEDKGVFVLFKAIKYLKEAGIVMNLTIMGSGDLENECRAFAKKDHGSVNVIYRDLVKYGDEFFSVITEYDLVLILNLKQEQPRIVFDAFSQGIGVIAPDTAGILDITIEKENAAIFKCGDPENLAEVIVSMVESPENARRMGLKGLDYIDGKTHINMHLDRQKFFSKVLSYGQND